MPAVVCRGRCIGATPSSSSRVTANGGSCRSVCFIEMSVPDAEVMIEVSAALLEAEVLGTDGKIMSAAAEFG